MTQNRLGGIALIVGAIGGLVTMSLHPSGHQLATSEQFESTARLAVAVHGLAIASLAVSFFGALALTRSLTSAHPLVIVALVVYGLAVPAAMIAAAASGFIATNVARRLLGAAPQAREIWQSLLVYTGVVNQTFARISAIGWGVSILLWSVSILKNRTLARGVGVYGILIGPAMIVAIISGLRLNVHGIGSVVILGPAIWFLVVGAMLIRRGD